MRFVRDFAGAAGASGSMVAAGGLLVAVVSAGLAFHGWPGLPHSDRAGIGAIELGDDAARHDAAHVRPAAASTLPAVPVVTGAAAGPRAAARPRARHTPHRPPRDGRPPAVTAPVPPAAVAPAMAPVSDRSGSPSGDDPSVVDGSAPASRVPSGGGASPVPATPSAPATPSIPSTPTPAAPDPKQAVEDTTQAAARTVQDVTDAAAQTVRPASPRVADTVSSVGQAVAGTVTDLGRIVGGLLAGP